MPNDSAKGAIHWFQCLFVLFCSLLFRETRAKPWVLTLINSKIKLIVTPTYGEDLVTHSDIRIAMMGWVILTKIHIVSRHPYFAQRDFEKVYSIFQSWIIHLIFDIFEMWKLQKLFQVIAHILV